VLKKPTEDQFALEKDRITHIPTNAWWSAYPGHSEPQFRSEGLLGCVLENGDEYEAVEVEKLALRLLAKRVK
jgi:hypothetical protein